VVPTIFFWFSDFYGTKERKRERKPCALKIYFYLYFIIIDDPTIVDFFSSDI